MTHIATVTQDGQTTIPADLRRELGIQDKVVFRKEGNRLVMVNASMDAFTDLQQALAGEAEALGLQTEDDVVAMVKEIRRERWENRNAHHA